MFSVRIATTDDFEFICDLVVALGLIAERSRITNTLENSTYWIACEGTGQPIGCIGLEHDDGASLLRSAAVMPAYQGMGNGIALAQTAIQCARDRGDRSVYLFSSKTGRYWEQFGFIPVSVWELAEALPSTPQVRSGIERGWLSDEIAWVLSLQSPLTTGSCTDNPGAIVTPFGKVDAAQDFRAELLAPGFHKVRGSEHGDVVDRCTGS